MSTKEYVSPLAQLIAQRERKVHEFDISGFFNLKGEAIPKLGVRVPVKAEQDEAIVAAYVALSAATKNADAAKSDDDIVRDLKTLHILHRCCVDPTKKTSPAGVVFYDHAFPSPDWMRRNMTTEQIGVLLNLVNEVRRIEGPAPSELDDATVDVFHDAAVNADTSTAADFLAACDREFLGQLFIAEAKRLRDARDEVDVLSAKLDAQKDYAAASEHTATESP